MNNPVKVLVTSKKKLQFKYGNNFSALEKLFKTLITADAKKSLDTKLIYIDDDASAKAAGIKATKLINEKTCKKAIDDISKKHTPAYIMIVGAQDVIPFQCIINPAGDDGDAEVESDLPYACESAYSSSINDFTGPTRVVGRLPDLPGVQKNISYFTTLINNIIKQKPAAATKYNSQYFAISTSVWKKSTAMTLQSVFNSHEMLLLSPSGKPDKPFTKGELKPLIHFYNCHGAKVDPGYYGQKGKNFPTAIASTALAKNIAYGTVIAAECCYGAQLYDSSDLKNINSIASTYLQYGAVTFMGSTTIAYGPSDSNSLADLMTRYFIESILNGASAGRALLEARQKFLSESGPQLDPYELKTLAQFLLLGDPSVQPVMSEESAESKTMIGGSVQNNRMRLASKGINLANTISPSVKTNANQVSANEEELNNILRKAKFDGANDKGVFAVKANKSLTGIEKKITDSHILFRTYIKKKKNNRNDFQVLVVKENKDQILGWRMYESK